VEEGVVAGGSGDASPRGHLAEIAEFAHGFP